MFQTWTHKLLSKIKTLVRAQELTGKTLVDRSTNHYSWEKGIKSLYYLRSKSVQRAGFAGGVEADNTADAAKYELAAGGEQTDYEECLACQ